MTSSTYLVCLMTLLPIIFSLPTPPITTDPAIKIQVTAKGLEKIGEYLTKYMSHYARDISSDKHTYKGYFTVDKVGSVDITTIPSDHAAESYEGFKTVERRERTKRDTTEGPIKMYYEDTEFLAGKKIGGLQLVTKDVEYKFNVTRGEHHYYIQRTGGACKTRVYIGQEDGHIKLARVAMESEGGEFEVMKDGHALTSDEEKLGFEHKYIEIVLQEILKKFSFYESHEFVMGFDQVVFDYRLTDHPLFKDGGMKIGFVGKFFYDEAELYKGKFLDLSKLSDAAKLFRTTTQTHFGDDLYTEIFEVVKTDSTPETTALAAEGSDDDEEARKAGSCIKICIGEDLFNSAVDVLVKSSITDVTLSRSTIVEFIDRYNGMVAEDKKLDPSTLAPDFKIGFKLTHLPDAGKNVRFYDGGVKEKFSFEITMDGKKAQYVFDSEALILFRNGKFARDLLKVIVEKKADDGYPKLMTKELLERYLNDYLEFVDKYFFAETLAKISEFAFKDGRFVLGFNDKGLKK